MIVPRRNTDPLQALSLPLAAEIRAAAKEVDITLFEVTRELSLSERIVWASGCAKTLSRLKNADGAR